MNFTKYFKVLTSSNNKIILINIQGLHLKSRRREIKPQTDINERLLKIAVIGLPNAGKSTFINFLMDRKVCPTSTKVHTTRKKSCAIFTENDAQIVFLDTPGLVTDVERKRHQLEDSFISDSHISLKEADVIGVIHDVSNSYLRDRLDKKIIDLLGKHIEKPSLLFLNKVDTLKSKRKLLDLTRVLTENCLNGKPISTYTKKMVDYKEQMAENVKDKKGWPYFSEIFMISALTGSGLPEVKEMLINIAKKNSWIFPENVFSDQKPEDIIVDSVKARLLNFLPQEIPYLLEPYLEYFDINEEGVIKTVVLVKCPTERINKLVVGAANGRLKQIIEAVQEDLQNVFQTRVRINIVMDVRKG